MILFVQWFTSMLEGCIQSCQCVGVEQVMFQYLAGAD